MILCEMLEEYESKMVRGGDVSMFYESVKISKEHSEEYDQEVLDDRDYHFIFPSSWRLLIIGLCSCSNSCSGFQAYAFYSYGSKLSNQAGGLKLDVKNLFCNVYVCQGVCGHLRNGNF